MNINVTVVTNPELGWDCVVDVIKGDEQIAKETIYQDYEDKDFKNVDLDDYFDALGYVFHDYYTIEV